MHISTCQFISDEECTFENKLPSAAVEDITRHLILKVPTFIAPRNPDRSGHASTLLYFQANPKLFSPEQTKKNLRCLNEMHGPTLTENLT
jgi:hypothetical protein